MKITTIVSTYNGPEALRLCLQSLILQEDRDFEIVVADDGSGVATRDTIARFADETAVPVRHVWHEDRGFRLAAIRNRAIAASSGDYLLFLDGDCIVLPDFVRVHRRLAEPSWFVTGRRSNVGARVTQRIMQARPMTSYGGRCVWFGRSLLRQSTRPFHFMKAPLGPLRKRTPTAWRGVLGCNLAIWRRDLDAVNGFDERYVGYGGEDTDLVIRLLRAGARRKRGDMASIVLHLHHPRRPGSSTNGGLLAELRSSDRSRAIIGLCEARAANTLALAATIASPIVLK
jgi:glycosyltransferase involved in cell wall biosynthesis